MHRYLDTVRDTVCLDVLSCLLGIYKTCAVEIESAFVCRRKEKQLKLFSLTCGVHCGVDIFMIPLLGSFCEVFMMLRGWEGNVPLSLDGKSMLL